MATKYSPYVAGNLQEWHSETPSGSSFDPDRRWVEQIRIPDPSANWGFRYVNATGYWQKNEPFEATMTYSYWEKGRSAMRFVWKDEEGHTFPMFMKDADVILSGSHSGEIIPGGALKIKGTWMVMKRGANYGIALVDANE